MRSNVRAHCVLMTPRLLHGQTHSLQPRFPAGSPGSWDLTPDPRQDSPLHHSPHHNAWPLNRVWYISIYEVKKNHFNKAIHEFLCRVSEQRCFVSSNTRFGGRKGPRRFYRVFTGNKDFFI